MNVFWSAVLYFAIGGALMYPAAIAVEVKCRAPFDNKEFMGMVAIWPAVIGAGVVSLFTDTSSKYECGKLKETKP